MFTAGHQSLRFLSGMLSIEMLVMVFLTKKQKHTKRTPVQVWGKKKWIYSSYLPQPPRPPFAPIGCRQQKRCTLLWEVWDETPLQASCNMKQLTGGLGGCNCAAFNLVAETSPSAFLSKQTETFVGGFIENRLISTKKSKQIQRSHPAVKLRHLKLG